MSDNLKIFGTTYTNVTGIKATDTNDTVQTFIKPTGTLNISTSGTQDCSAYANVSVPSGSATTPSTSITANPTISVSSGGLISASVSASQSVTPTVSAGYVSSGTSGTVTVSGSNTSQMTVQGATTYTPSTSDQTIASDTYLTGTQTISGDADLIAGNIKKDVSIFGVTGTFEGSGGGATNIVQGTFTTGSTRATRATFTINYTGSGYPIALLVYVNGGAYNNSTGGNTTWYNSTNRYDVGWYAMVKSRIPATPSYLTSNAENYGTVAIIYKNSTSQSTTYSRTSGMAVNAYTQVEGQSGAGTACVKFYGNGKTVQYYIGNNGSSSIGLAPSTEFAYIAIYSS